MLLRLKDRRWNSLSNEIMDQNTQPPSQASPPPVQAVIPTPPPKNNFNIIIGILIFILGIIVGLMIDKTTLFSNLRIPYLGATPTPTLLPTPVLGIRLTQCCSCPTMIDASQIGKNGWVAYEQGKDYTSQLPKSCSLPNIGACAPCPPLETKSYTCPPSGWADCMPSPNSREKCTEEEMNWYKANCPDFKGGAY